MQTVSRLTLKAGVLALCFILPWTSVALAKDTGEPAPKTPIKHLIVLLQQNHTFDNYFGTYPGADGITPDTCVPVDPFDSQNKSCQKPQYIGNGPIEDMSHTPQTFWLEYNQGLNNGFVYMLSKVHQDPTVSLSYFDGRDLPYYWNLADEYVLFDRFFTSAHGGSIWNRMFWVAGQAGSNFQRIPDHGWGDIPTIFDRLQQIGVSWKFYINNYDPKLNYRVQNASNALYPEVQWVPLLGFDRFIDDPALSSRIVDMDEYFKDLTNGTLPSVSYMMVLGASEHPPQDPNTGQQFVRNLLQALAQSSAWDSSAFLLAYDDWGGWYDHVPPPQVDSYGYGFRTPALLVSPYAKQGFIDHTTHDFTSILKFIEENYGLDPLSTRDKNAISISTAFDFNQPPRRAKILPFERQTLDPKQEPKRIVIYLIYGGAMALAVAILGLSLKYSRFLTSRNARPNESQIRK